MVCGVFIHHSFLPHVLFFPPSWFVQPFELLLGCLRNPFIIFNAEFFKATYLKLMSPYLLNRRKKSWTINDSELFTCNMTNLLSGAKDDKIEAVCLELISCL